MKVHFLSGLAAVSLIAGCTFNQPINTVQTPVGAANAQNDRIQLAYGNIEERLRDLSIAFRAASPDTVTFDFDSSRLSSETRQALNQQAAWLLANESVRMAVIGHADAPGTDRYNDRLGLRRARAVLGYLVRRGVARDRLDELVSRGESEPVVATDGRERQNRRVVTAVVGFDRVYVGDGLDGRYTAKPLNEYLQSGVGDPPFDID
ncbi:MAG: OmpA family protein [Pseudomonadota bacterium]